MTAKKGVEITFNSLVDTLGKLGVEIFGTHPERIRPESSQRSNAH